MAKYIVLIIQAAALIISSGCSLHTSYPLGYEYECKKWVCDAIESKRKGLSPSEAEIIFPNIKDRYRYYICLNSVIRPAIIYEDIFFADAEQSAAVAGESLKNLQTDHEIYLTVYILYKIHTSKKFNVLENKELAEAVLEAKAKIKNKERMIIVEAFIRQMKEISFDR